MPASSSLLQEESFLSFHRVWKYLWVPTVCEICFARQNQPLGDGGYFFRRISAEIEMIKDDFQQILRFFTSQASFIVTSFSFHVKSSLAESISFRDSVLMRDGSFLWASWSLCVGTALNQVQFGNQIKSAMGVNLPTPYLANNRQFGLKRTIQSLFCCTKSSHGLRQKMQKTDSRMANFDPSGQK